jgi:hypothetical protein
MECNNCNNINVFAYRFYIKTYNEKNEIVTICIDCPESIYNCIKSNFNEMNEQSYSMPKERYIKNIFNEIIPFLKKLADVKKKMNITCNIYEKILERMKYYITLNRFSDMVNITSDWLYSYTIDLAPTYNIYALPSETKNIGISKVTGNILPLHKKYLKYKKKYLQLKNKN